MPILIFVMVLAALIAAAFITKWIAERPDAPISTERFSAVTDKSTALQDQVNSKILWDAPNEEVLDWLEEKHSITRDAAEKMISIAHAERKKSIRQKALIGLVCSTIAVLLTAVGSLVSSGAMYAVLGVSLVAFFRYLHRFLTGTTTSSAGL